MADGAGPKFLPSLPQNDDEKRSKRRRLELSIARTRYNYTNSYLYPAPLAAQVPSSDTFSLAYKAKVAPVLFEIAENLQKVLVERFEAQLRSDLPAMPMPWMVALRKATVGNRPNPPASRFGPNAPL